MTSNNTSPATKRGRGRPRIGSKIQIILPPDLVADIDAEATRRSITRSDEIRRRCTAFARIEEPQP